MSWHIRRVGSASDILRVFEREAEASARQSHNGESAKAMIRASAKIVKHFAEGIDPNAMIDATISGHLDGFGGNAKVELAIVPSAALPEQEWVTKALADAPAEVPAGSGG